MTYLGLQILFFETMIKYCVNFSIHNKSYQCDGLTGKDVLKIHLESYNLLNYN